MENAVTFDVEASISSSEEGESSLGGAGLGFQSKLLKQRSSLFVDEDKDDKEDDLLRRVIAESGLYAAEVVYVQLWIMNADSTRLVRPETAWWMDSVFHKCTPGTGCSLCRLTDRSRTDYLPAEPLPIGVGLAGTLWAAVQQKGNGIVWREIQSIASDPFQPWNLRLQLIAECGFGMAAAVPFSVLGEEGIIVFMTRKDVNMERLQSEANEAFLMSAAQLIGSAFVFRGLENEAKQERKRFLKASLQRAKAKILALRAFGFDLSVYTERHSLLPKSRKDNIVSHAKMKRKQHDVATCIDPSRWIPASWLESLEGAKAFAATTFAKCKGAGVPPPPAASYQQSAWTLAGTFFTLVMLTTLNEHFASEYDIDHTIVLPPFGATLTLIYGLMAAPVSQPRNAILGQTLSISIALIVSYASFLPAWARQSVATSLSITGMVKLGIIHPPAGAAAMLFATGNLGWTNMVFMLLANLLAIFTATVINNMSNKRQYPNSWGLQGLVDLLTILRKDFKKLP